MSMMIRVSKKYFKKLIPMMQTLEEQTFSSL